MPAVRWPLSVERIGRVSGVMFECSQANTGVFDVCLPYISEISTAEHVQDCIIKGCLRTKADTGQQSCGFFSDKLFFHFYALSLAMSQCHNIKLLSLFHSNCDAGLHR